MSKRTGRWHGKTIEKAGQKLVELLNVETLMPYRQKTYCNDRQ